MKSPGGWTAFPPFLSQVVAGRDNSCGIRSNGRVDCWGSNMMGQSMPPRDVQFRQLSASNSRYEKFLPGNFHDVVSFSISAAVGVRLAQT